jgi:hypothetical protein
VASTTRPVPATDLCGVDGIRCLRAERLILEAPLFDFTREELEIAIDSAIRLRLVSEERLRARVAVDRSLGVNGSRSLVDALVDTGGESKLERAFLAVLRRAGLPRPELQVSHRDGLRLIARAVSVEPVKATPAMSGWAVRAAPTLPSPGTNCATSRGMPAS